VKKNQCHFDRLEELVPPLLYTDHDPEVRRQIKTQINDYIWNVIEPYVEFIEVDMDNSTNFLTECCRRMTECFPSKQTDRDFFYHTEGSYSFPKKYIEFMHCQPLWKEYQESQKENMNYLACLFSLQHHVIENDVIVFANSYQINGQKSVALESITKSDLIRMVRRRFFFSGILIREHDFVKYYYQNPQFLITKIYGLTLNDSIQKLSVDLLRYNLIFYFQHDKNLYLNKIATRMNGLYQLHGDILLLHELEENIFANLSIHETRRLNVLSYGRLYDRQLKDDEIHTTTVTDVDENGQEHTRKVTPFWSRYHIINRRMIKWQSYKNKCINCGENMENPITCSKCFRVKYCSEQCQKEFDHYHYEECINVKSLV